MPGREVGRTAPEMTSTAASVGATDDAGWAASPGTAGVRPVQLYIDPMVGAAVIDVDVATLVAGASLWVAVCIGATPDMDETAPDIVGATPVLAGVEVLVDGSEFSCGGE